MKRTGRCCIVITLAMLGGLAHILCGQAAGNEEFTIAFLGDLSGPVGFWNAPRLVGIQDAIDYLNATSGGIAGRKLKLEWRDHKSNAGLADGGYTELHSKRFLIWHTCGSGEQQLLKLRHERDKSQITFTCSTSPGVIYPTGHIFGTAPYYPDQFGAFVDWLKENWDEQTMQRRPRVAFMTYDSGYGRSCITKEVMDYAKSRGVDIVDTIYIPFVTTDASTPLKSAKKAGADWLFGQWLWQTLPPYLKANREQSLGLKFCVNSFGVDDVMLIHHKEAAEGLTGVTSWYLPTEDTPGLRLVKEALQSKSRRPEDQGASYFLGWMNVFQTKRAVEQTLARVGAWDEITPAEIILTLETWRDVDIHGLGKLNYSPTERAASSVRIVQVKDGKWVPVTDWRKAPDLVPPEWKSSGQP